MKPIDFNLKNKRTSRLLLLLCVIGVLAAAWWAWAAGPIRTESAVGGSQSAQDQSKLSGSAYNPLKPAASSTASSPLSATDTNVSPAAPPVSTQPSLPTCRPLGGAIQPDSLIYPCNCSLAGTIYQCCNYNSGTELLCPERL